MLRKGIVVALGLSFGAFVLRAIKQSKVPPYDWSRKELKEPPRSPDAPWTWARFQGDDLSPGG